jgi:hypothetical protein
MLFCLLVPKTSKTVIVCGLNLLGQWVSGSPQAGALSHGAINQKSLKHEK